MTPEPSSASDDRALDGVRGGAPALDALVAAGVQPGDLVGLAATSLGPSTHSRGGMSGGGSWVVVASGRHRAVCSPAEVAQLDRRLRPRWVLWSTDTAAELLRHGVVLGRAWHLGAVHRILRGGWRCDPMRVWCATAGLPLAGAPIAGQLDLLGAGGDGDPLSPVRPDGYLRAEWVDGAWAGSSASGGAWAALAVDVARRQHTELAALDVGGDALALARAESTTELLCAEMAGDGLPLHMPTAENLIGALIGPRTRSETEAVAARARRDAEVLAHVPGSSADLRNPADVRGLLRRVGLDLDDTRAWRLETVRDRHPVVEALLQWRKAERIATTYGYGWLEQHVRVPGEDKALGRLCGEWSGSDGAAGRMTATAGLHNLPAELRPAVRAEPGHLFVRADLGQIEPRVLAVVSGDAALVRAAQADDLYAPVAAQLQVDRPTAKVAVLAAMYGQTSGAAGEARRRMDIAYPVAMAFLERAALAGTEGRDLRTFGGRLVRMYDIDDDGDEQRSAAAARGRYARNAMVQGAAAELFKAWAVTVRARVAPLDARIVLCLHDELLLHCPQDAAEAVAQSLRDCLAEAAHRWQRGAGVRFVADVGVVRSWADAKP